MTEPICDKTPGCVAFGQMQAFVTHYYFESQVACEAAAKAPQPIAGSFMCGSAPAEVSAYGSTVKVVSKMPWSCYTTSQ